MVTYRKIIYPQTQKLQLVKKHQVSRDLIIGVNAIVELVSLEGQYTKTIANST